LLYDPTDAVIQERFISNAKPAAHRYETVLSVLETNLQALGKIDIARSTGLSETVLRTILVDLEDQEFIERNREDRTYTLLRYQGQVDFSDYDIVREHFPLIQPTQRTRDAVARFLHKEWLPRIEKRRIGSAPAHEMGWSLSYHGSSATGQLVRASKYEGAGAFAMQLVTDAIDVINTRYPVGVIDAIVSVPSTRSGSLVEDFARQVASELNIAYSPVLQEGDGVREKQQALSAPPDQLSLLIKND
jgi:hypothetical protein